MPGLYGIISYFFSPRHSNKEAENNKTTPAKKVPRHIVEGIFENPQAKQEPRPLPDEGLMHYQPMFPSPPSSASSSPSSSSSPSPSSSPDPSPLASSKRKHTTHTGAKMEKKALPSKDDDMKRDEDDELRSNVKCYTKLNKYFISKIKKKNKSKTSHGYFLKYARIEQTRVFSKDYFLMPKKSVIKDLVKDIDLPTFTTYIKQLHLEMPKELKENIAKELGVSFYSFIFEEKKQKKTKDNLESLIDRHIDNYLDDILNLKQGSNPKIADYVLSTLEVLSLAYEANLAHALESNQQSYSEELADAKMTELLNRAKPIVDVLIPFESPLQIPMMARILKKYREYGISAKLSASNDKTSIKNKKIDKQSPQQKPLPPTPKVKKSQQTEK